MKIRKRFTDSQVQNESKLPKPAAESFYNDVFWGEIAPCDHLVQIYENDEIFLHALEGFTGNGLLAGESVIIIATDSHLKALESRLSDGFDVNKLKSADRYIPFNADEALSEFMIKGRVDQFLFTKFITKALTRARTSSTKTRAFGEMVALLWNRGQREATFALEYLWTEFCKSEKFSLFCAYPKSGFTQDAAESIKHICTAHTKMIEGKQMSSPEINYYGSGLSISPIG
jgi:DcmR-like sensory protein